MFIKMSLGDEAATQHTRSCRFVKDASLTGRNPLFTAREVDNDLT